MRLHAKNTGPARMGWLVAVEVRRLHNSLRSTSSKQGSEQAEYVYVISVD